MAAPGAIVRVTQWDRERERGIAGGHAARARDVCRWRAGHVTSAAASASATVRRGGYFLGHLRPPLAFVIHPGQAQITPISICRYMLVKGCQPFTWTKAKVLNEKGNCSGRCGARIFINFIASWEMDQWEMDEWGEVEKTSREICKIILFKTMNTILFKKLDNLIWFYRVTQATQLEMSGYEKFSFDLWYVITNHVRMDLGHVSWYT